MSEKPWGVANLEVKNDSNGCKHGISRGLFCESCLNDSRETQPVWAMIDRLVESSEKKGIERRHKTGSDYEIETNGETFEIVSIIDGKDPKFSEVQELLEEVFLKEETDPEEILRDAIDGITPFGTQNDARYKFYAVRNPEGKTVSTFGCTQLDILDESGRSTGETVLLVGYAATKNDVRQKGLAKEGYISALIDAAMEAQARGKKLSFAAGDCVYSSEIFWNKVGWKRVYAKIGEKEFTELPYLQPAFEFDTKTGEIAPDAGVTAEHFMIDAFGKRPPSKEQIMSAVRAFFRDNSLWPEEAFAGNPEERKKAQENNQNHVVSLEKQIEEFIENKDQILFLTAEARERARKFGLKINDWEEADRGDETDSENF